MDNREIIMKMENIFSEIFDKEDICLTEESSSDSIEEWDSLSHIQIVNSIQKVFGIKINAREMMEWNNVGDMVETIKQKIND